MAGNSGGNDVEPGSGVAVNDATHDVYVADSGNNRIDQFSASGNFIRAWGWGVLNGAAELQVCTAGTGCQTGSGGREPGQLGQSFFVAVDNSIGGGEAVYVASLGRLANAEIQTITLSGAAGGTFTLDLEGDTTAPIAFGAAPASVRQALENLPSIGTGNVEVFSDQSGYELRFSGALSGVDLPPVSGDASGLTPGGASIAVATDSNGAPLIPGLVTKFGPDGKLIESWGADGQLDGSLAPAGPLGQPTGITVDSSGHLWVSVGSTGKAPGAHIYSFDSSGSFLSSHVALHVRESEPSPQGLAIRSDGDLFMGTNAMHVEKLSPTGEWLGTVYQTPLSGGFNLRLITAFAVNPATDDLYVDEGSSIRDISRQCETAPGGLTCVPTQTFGSPQLDEAAGLGLDTDGTIYVANTAADQIAVFKVSLEATVQAASEVKATEATLEGRIDPKGTAVPQCAFQYGPTTSYGQTVPCLNEAGEEVGTQAHPITTATNVHADLEGLAGGAHYHYRLHATNTAKEPVFSEDETLDTLLIAVIGEAEATELTATSATLKAKVNPKGLAASCQIQWGTSTAYGTTIPCQPPSLGSGTNPVSVSAQIEGLSPGTTYHWRVLATDANGTATGPDNTFVFLTGPEVEHPCANEALREANGSSALPDCRAYELVTSPQKNGALFAPVIFGLSDSIAADGSRLIASTLQCFANSQSCTGDRASKGPPFEFERTSSGWQVTPLAPPASSFENNSVWAYSADTGMVLYSSAVPSQVTDEFYAREPGGAMEGIGLLGESHGFDSISSSPLIATHDLSHVVYESSSSVLWPSFDETEQGSLYEYAGLGHSQPLLVGVSGGAGSTDLISSCGANLGGAGGPAVPEALSADGRIVYFTVRKCAHGSGANSATPVPAAELYARIENEGLGARSVLISGRSPSECSGSCASSPPAAANLEGASADGSVVLFTSTQQLTNDAAEDSSGDSAASEGCSSTRGPNGCNLYLYEDPQEEPLSGHNLVAVSAGDSSGIGPQVQRVIALSADGTHVYYIARGVLAGPNAEGKQPTEGAENLYLYERDAAHPGGRTAFVATLSGTEARRSSIENVTANGRFLVFLSRRALTPDTTRAEGPSQVFRYDAATEELLRISIGQRGFNDNGNAGAGDAGIAAPAFAGQRRRDPSMSADGSRVFFQSPVGLTPGALDDVPVNARGGSANLAQNIYEWEAQGKGGCEEASGCVSLISDGRDATEGNSGPHATASAVELLGTDASGENVFFATDDPLVPADTDTGYDIYDARVGGGFAAPSQPVPCQGDACKGPGTQQGAVGSPATPGFSGTEEGPKHPQKPKRKHKKHRKKAHKQGKRAANANRGGQK